MLCLPSNNYCRSRLWLDRFTTDNEAYGFGALYLGIVAPFYAAFGGGQAVYFASQGTGHMVLPVLVNVLRFTVVAGIGSLAVSFGWDLKVIFAAVAAGLMIVFIGMPLCLYSAPWRPDRDLTHKA